MKMFGGIIDWKACKQKTVTTFWVFSSGPPGTGRAGKATRALQRADCEAQPPNYRTSYWHDCDKNDKCQYPVLISPIHNDRAPVYKVCNLVNLSNVIHYDLLKCLYISGSLPHITNDVTWTSDKAASQAHLQCFITANNYHGPMRSSWPTTVCLDTPCRFLNFQSIGSPNSFMT
jgi:hypothetical protein